MQSLQHRDLVNGIDLIITEAGVMTNLGHHLHEEDVEIVSEGGQYQQITFDHHVIVLFDPAPLEPKVLPAPIPADIAFQQILNSFQTPGDYPSKVKAIQKAVEAHPDGTEDELLSFALCILGSNP